LLFPFYNNNITGIGIQSFNTIAQIYQEFLPEVNVYANENNLTGSSSFITALLIIILCGSLFLFVRLLMQLFVITRLRSPDFSAYLACKVYSPDKVVAPFSFFNWIFMPQDIYTKEDREIMLNHETIHANQYHSIDILVCEIFCTLFWWNPGAWILKKEIKINLEHLADEGVIKMGVDIKKYQILLLQITYPGKIIYPVVNNFNISQLKRRIGMINEPETNGFLKSKYLFILPLVLFILSANIYSNITGVPQNTPDPGNNISGRDKNINDNTYTAVEEMPQYPGGDRALMRFISENIEYPQESLKNGIEGRVIIRFIVSKTGKVQDVSILRSLDTYCDAEASRVVKTLQNWIPGKQDGKSVDVYYTLPVLFKLDKDEKS